jgi:cell wall-associated NlpC family hydrolase
VANRLSQHARFAVLAASAVLGVTLILPAGAGAVPRTEPAAQPTIAEVQQQLSELSKTNSQLVDRYDRAQGDVQAKRRAAARAERAAVLAARRLEQAHTKLKAGAAAMYEGGSFSATGALLTSNSGSSYLDQLDTLSMLSSHSSQMVDDVSAAQKLAKAARLHADALLVSAKDKRDALVKQQAHVRKQITKYRALLAKLNAAQRAAYLARQSPKVSQNQIASATANLDSTSNSSSSSAAVTSSDHTSVGSGGSTAGTKAVEFALAQVGKPYVWGAAGPDAYDCSGLTSQAWAAAGVSLPHSALQQYSYGTHVSFSQMVPGDLMFFYSPIGHVAIYIGNGLMVSAPQTGENVKVIPADTFNNDFVGATHLG